MEQKRAPFVHLVFPDEIRKSKQRTKYSSNDTYTTKKTFLTKISFLSIVYLCLFVCFGLYEATKFHSCYIQSKDLINRDHGAHKESVCIDDSKIARFGHRFGKGCKDALQSVEEGITHLTYKCFVSRHKIYDLVSLDNMYMNIFMGLTILYVLMLVKDHYTQVQIAKHQTKILSDQMRFAGINNLKRQSKRKAITY